MRLESDFKLPCVRRLPGRLSAVGDDSERLRLSGECGELAEGEGCEGTGGIFVCSEGRRNRPGTVSEVTDADVRSSGCEMCLFLRALYVESSQYASR